MKKQNALVSVGIPTYNRPEGLHRTLQSITSQTYKNIEIIVSDNCSSDPQVKIIIDEFTKEHSNIQAHIHEKNHGAFYNFKFVLEMAKGEYFMWAADDDFWSSNFIEECINYFTSDDIGIVMPSYRVKSLSNNPLNLYFKRYKKFKELKSSSYSQRLSSFILHDELTHKANFIYGVWKKNLALESYGVLKKLEYGVIDTSRHQIGEDIVILVYALSKKKFIMTNRVCFYKYYKGRVPGNLRSFFKNWVSKFSPVKMNPNYLQHILLIKQVLSMVGIDKKTADNIIDQKIRTNFDNWIKRDN